MNSEFWHRKRVLVTGGCGFVGRWLCRALAPAEVDLHILDLMPARNFEIPHSFHRADMRDLSAMQQLLDQVNSQVIIHLAGQPGVGSSHDNPLGAFEANAVATFNLLEGCRKRGSLDAIVAVSSNHVYGEQHHRPTREDAPLNGEGMYAASKLCGDVLARCYGKIYGLPIGIARMTNSYGGDDHHVAHIITSSIHSVLKAKRPIINQSGRDRKGYLYIKDTAEGLLAVAEGIARNADLRGEAFNLVPNEAVSVTELVAAIASAAGSNLAPEIRQPSADFEHEHLDNSKARRLLGWSPRYTLAEGLKESIAWYREHTA